MLHFGTVDGCEIHFAALNKVLKPLQPAEGSIQADEENPRGQIALPDVSDPNLQEPGVSARSGLRLGFRHGNLKVRAQPRNFGMPVI